MQADKKQLEILLIDYFRSVYPDFPKGKVVPAESPDFWVRKKNRNTIGIELTRLNPVNAVVPDEKRQNEIQFRNELLVQAKEIYERTESNILFVKFLFDDTKVITPERAMSVSVRLAGIIRNISNSRKNEVFFKESLQKNVLPEGLEEVLIVQHPKLTSSIWERSNNLGVSTNVVDDIKKAISKKDEKLRIYHRNHLNFYWLLITTDRLRGVRNYHLPNKIMNQHFESQFQHVFLFDLIKSKIFKLV